MVAKRVNALTLIACWQSGQYRHARIQDRVLAAAEDVASSLASEEQEPSRCVDEDYLPSSESQRIFRMWQERWN
jgi:hypothetical protein